MRPVVSSVFIVSSLSLKGKTFSLYLPKEGLTNKLHHSFLAHRKIITQQCYYIFITASLKLTGNAQIITGLGVIIINNYQCYWTENFANIAKTIACEYFVSKWKAKRKRTFIKKYSNLSVFFFSSSRARSVCCKRSVKISSSWVSLYSSRNCSPSSTRSRVASCSGMSLRYRPLRVRSSRFITLVNGNKRSGKQWSTRSSLLQCLTCFCGGRRLQICFLFLLISKTSINQAGHKVSTTSSEITIYLSELRLLSPDKCSSFGMRSEFGGWMSELASMFQLLLFSVWQQPFVKTLIFSSAKCLWKQDLDPALLHLIFH